MGSVLQEPSVEVLSCLYHKPYRIKQKRRNQGSVLHGIKSQCQRSQPKCPSTSGEFSSNITILPSAVWHLHEVLAVKNSTDVPQTPRHPHHRCFPGDIIYLHAVINACTSFHLHISLGTPSYRTQVTGET